MQLPILFERARILDPATQHDETADFFVDAGGRIAPVPQHLHGVRRIDASHLVLCPGFWDVHVHFRDPGKGDAETLQSGARAAAAGGFTHVVTMPNTEPACDSPALIAHQLGELPVRILPSGCITQGRRGECVADLEAMTRAGAAAFTDDGGMVWRREVMLEGLRRAKALGRVVMDHAVLPALAGTGMARSGTAQRKFAWPEFPAAAEVEAVRQDIELAQLTGAALHVQHLSCAESIRLLRAARGAVTCEVTPHHLAFSTEDISDDDGHWKMNPPLGTPADVEVLCEGIFDGTVACFATDHAPHSAASKSRGFAAAPFGVIGLETAVGATWTEMVLKRGLAPLVWAHLWTQGPARVLNRMCPMLREGEVANLVLLDLTHSWRVDPTHFYSMSRNCPFAGRELTGRAVFTLCEGRVTFDSL